MARLLVVNLRSVSYSGTSWVNLVLGSHPEGMALGPPDRVWTMPVSDVERACLVHDRACAFWPDFLRARDPDGNFLLQLAERTGRRFIVLNNPTRDFQTQVMEHPEIDVRPIRVVRDGRANIVSLMRHHPERYERVYDALRGWLEPALGRLEALVRAGSTPWITIRYEDMIRDCAGELARVGAHLGIEYTPDAVRYWQWGHHLTASNAGVIDLLKRFEGAGRYRHHRADVYGELFEQTRSRPDTPVTDDSWRDLLSDEDRLAYDYVLGPVHEALGYERDRFTTDEVLRFIARHGLPPDRADAPAALSPQPAATVETAGKPRWPRRRRAAGESRAGRGSR